jgi:hypothetical protein
MEKKVKVKLNDFSKYFKGLNLDKRLSVMESARTLLEIQKEDAGMIADAPVAGKKK